MGPDEGTYNVSNLDFDSEFSLCPVYTDLVNPPSGLRFEPIAPTFVSGDRVFADEYTVTFPAHSTDSFSFQLTYTDDAETEILGPMTEIWVCDQ